MPDRQPPLDLFVGRAAELTRVAEIMTRVAAGQPWLIAIEGDPGVGKTALARRCLTGVPGLRVLSARAGEAETGLTGRQQLRRFVGQWRQPAAV